MVKKSIPNFLDVFEKRIDAQRTLIKDELQKDKSKRDRKFLKHVLGDIKSLRRAVRAAREDHSKRCPHCGEKI